MRHFIRTLLREKVFSATILATFALCIGANALIFTVVHGILIKPLAFPNSNRLVITENSYPKAGVLKGQSSIPNYFERKEGVPAFADIGAFRLGTAVISNPSAPERTSLGYATPSFFRVLAVSAACGRLFSESDPAKTVVLSDAFWRAHFNADPSAIGQSIRIEGHPCAIVGILPAKFDYMGTDVRLWAPLKFDNASRAPAMRHANSIDIIARLKPGVSLAEAQTEIDSLNARSAALDAQDDAVRNTGFRTTVYGLRANYVDTVKPALLLLQAGALFLLLIGIVNLVNLFLIRASVRAKELAVRQVLGASRGRIVLQSLTETMFFAIIGGALGVALGEIGLRLIQTLGIQQLPLASSIRVDAPVIVTSLAGAVIVGSALAIPCIAANHRRALGQSLNLESRSGTSSRSITRLRHSLLVAQLALAFVLLAGSGLLGLSFRRVLAVEPGFRAESVVTGRVGMPWRYRDSMRFAFAGKLRNALITSPGVAAAGLSTTLPATGGAVLYPISVAGYTRYPGESIHGHYGYWVAGNYFEAMGIMLRAGRYLDAADSQTREQVCVVDDDFVRRYWPGISPLGRQILFWGKTYSVVGVVGAVKQTDLTEADAFGSVYLPIRAEDPPMFFIAVIKAAQSPALAIQALRQAVRRIDPGMPVEEVRTLSDRIDEKLTVRRSLMLLAAGFAAMALALAAVGVYGALAYAVTQRRREIGIRMALGALPQQILQHFLGLGCRLLLLGTAFGLVGTLLVGRMMDSLLFGVRSFDPAVIAGTTTVLGAIAMAASLLPAFAAAHLTPLEAIRED